MSASSLPIASPMPEKRFSFLRATLLAVVLEGLLCASLLAMGHAKPKTVGLRRKPMAVHFVTLPKPPKPHVRPKPPPPHPVVRPKPQPVPPKPRPIVHHRPVPLPTPVKKVPPPRPKVVPRPPTPPPPPPPSPAVVAQAVDRYAVMLRTRIQQGLVVPPRVAALRLSGKAVVAFELTPAGRLLWVRIMRSSGIGAIDRAALAAVRDRSYPPFTKSMPRRPTVFRVRVGLNDGRHRF
ncbi:energy transducer TonB [Acidiferrobacter thiooxydans]|jgi:protein TonB|nr:energy transducer TonB [Acidiferrobacter thiooxydans]UEO00294.1 energy transducer TonB [Acidiferrobacter thiooxydans]